MAYKLDRYWIDAKSESDVRKPTYGAVRKIQADAAAARHCANFNVAWRKYTFYRVLSSLRTGTMH